METVIGAFDDRDAAQRAVERLVQAGIPREDVHVQEGHTGAASMQDGGTGAGTQERWQGMESEVAMDRGVFASIGHFFTSLFGEDHPHSHHAGTYSEAVRRGSSVVVVDARDEQQAGQAATLLHELGAIDIDERANQWRAGGWNPQGQGVPTEMQDTPMQDTGTRATTLRDTAVGDRPMQTAAEGASSMPQREGVLDVVQEELRIGKREVDRGGVRVIQRVTQKPVREILRLREEHAVVERHPVDREATGADLSNFREGTVEVREMAEEPVVGKTARVVEEVRVGKEVQEREQTIEDTVRRKDVEIERMDGGAMRSPEQERAYASGGTAGSSGTGIGGGTSGEVREQLRERESGLDGSRSSSTDKPHLRGEEK